MVAAAQSRRQASRNKWEKALVRRHPHFEQQTFFQHSRTKFGTARFSDAFCTWQEVQILHHKKMRELMLAAQSRRQAPRTKWEKALVSRHPHFEQQTFFQHTRTKFGTARFRDASILSKNREPVLDGSREIQAQINTRREVGVGAQAVAGTGNANRDRATSMNEEERQPTSQQLRTPLRRL